MITDLTQLRKIKSMERVQGVSITRELLWWWGMRQATVQQLLDLLCRLELYRAAQIILNCESPRGPCAAGPRAGAACTLRPLNLCESFKNLNELCAVAVS